MFGITLNKTHSEERLLRKVQKGDTSAAESLYRLHVRYLSALCSRYLTNDEDIKDVLQEAFIKIFTLIGDFEYRGTGSLRGWMARITLNETLKFLRTDSRLNFVEMDERHKEIAALLGIKENTSASQLFKAKAMLARKIKQYRTINSV